MSFSARWWPSSSTSSADSLSAARWRTTLTVIALGSAVVVLASLAGCGRTVLVNPGSPVRIGPDASARIYALVDGEWRLSERAVHLPEGWYLVDPTFVEESQ